MKVSKSAMSLRWLLYAGAITFAVGCSGDEENAEEPVAASEDGEAETPVADTSAAGDQEIATDTTPAPDTSAADATPTPVAQTPANVEPTFLWAFAENVTVRAEPSKSAKSVRKLKYGEKVQAFEAAGQDHVRIGDGQFVPRKQMTDRKSRWSKDRAAH